MRAALCCCAQFHSRLAFTKAVTHIRYAKRNAAEGLERPAIHGHVALVDALAVPLGVVTEEGDINLEGEDCDGGQPEQRQEDVHGDVKYLDR